MRGLGGGAVLSLTHAFQSCSLHGQAWLAGNMHRSHAPRHALTHSVGMPSPPRSGRQEGPEPREEVSAESRGNISDVWGESVSDPAELGGFLA